MKDCYLAAAKLIADKQEDHTCIAVARASDPSYFGCYCEERPAVKKYMEAFTGRETGQGEAQQEIFMLGDDEEERRQIRITALLFMHWISQEAGDV